MYELTCDDNGHMPPSWMGLLMHMHDQYPHMTYSEYKPLLIKKLKEYNGEFAQNRIIFPDAESLTQFVITFS